jgi:energy-coupling factor transporter ATP-binding protein EcfA2
MRVVLLTGPAGSGKSEVAKHMSGIAMWDLHKMAGPLKEMLYSIGLEHRHLEGELKETPIPWMNDQTPRHLMQTLGTEWGRKCIHEDIWAALALRKVLTVNDKDFKQNFVFDDVRFQNEIDVFKLGIPSGATVINIVPAYDGYKPTTGQAHASENQELTWDYRITNDGSIQDLLNKVAEVLS